MALGKSTNNMEITKCLSRKLSRWKVISYINERARVSEGQKAAGYRKKVWEFLAKGVGFLGKVVEFWRCGVR